MLIIFFFKVYLIYLLSFKCINLIFNLGNKFQYYSNLLSIIFVTYFGYTIKKLTNQNIESNLSILLFFFLFL